MLFGQILHSLSEVVITENWSELKINIFNDACFSASLFNKIHIVFETNIYYKWRRRNSLLTSNCKIEVSKLFICLLLIWIESETIYWLFQLYFSFSSMAWITFFLTGFSHKSQRLSLCRNVVNTYLTLKDKNPCMEFLLVARIYIFWCPRRTLAFRDFARADGDHPIRDDTPACSATNQMFSGLAFPIF